MGENKKVLLTEAAKRAGRSHTYFSTMKITSPELFREMLEMGRGDLSMGYAIIRKNFYLSIDKIERMTLLMLEKRTLGKFSELLYDLGIYQNKSTFSSNHSKLLWGNRIKISWKAIIRIREITEVIHVFCQEWRSRYHREDTGFGAKNMEEWCHDDEWHEIAAADKSAIEEIFKQIKEKRCKAGQGTYVD